MGSRGSTSDKEMDVDTDPDYATQDPQLNMADALTPAAAASN